MPKIHLLNASLSITDEPIGYSGFAEGKVGQAFSLGGHTGYIEVPDAPGLRLASLTIEAWTILDGTAGARVVVAANPAGEEASDSYLLCLSSGTPMAAVGDPADLGAVLFAGKTLRPGHWYHLAYTVDDGTKTQGLYVNGLLVASGNLTKLPSYDAQPLLIGCDNDYCQRKFFLQGRIDEITIYNRALDYAEISGIYSAGPAGKKSGP